MTLRPDDKSLAAYLIESEIFPFETVLAALNDAEASVRDLGESLVHLGACAIEEMRAHRAAARRRPLPPDVLDADTWYDIAPAGGVGRGPTAGSEDLSDLSFDDADRAATAPEHPPLDATRPYEPGRHPEQPPALKRPPELEASGTDPERYRLGSEIGRGGMGRILSARDVDIGREVALKILHGGEAAPETSVRRFWTEIQATGQLEHPSIIPVHDVGRLANGELFYVMKKLSGSSLADILDALGDEDEEFRAEFDRPRLLTILQQIAYAVAFAHAHGVIHRDIKPANIMVGRYGEAILIDWGLAKIAGMSDPGEEHREGTERPVEMVGHFSGAVTATGMITGTPQYMSPEATEGMAGVVGPKTDVYGLGAVLYEILASRPAFPDEGFVPTVMKVRARDFMPPSRHRPKEPIPEVLEQLCLRAMAGDPAERPTAKALADELGRILQGARERERRQREARARIREGKAATTRWKRLKSDLQAEESEAKRLAKAVPGHADVSEKRALWSAEDRVSELKVEAVGAFEESEAAFLRALGEVPDDPQARAALAGLYFARFVEAEHLRDREGQRYFRRLVSRYDDGAWARVLDGQSQVRVESDPDVEIGVARYELEARVLVGRDEQSLGTGSVQTQLPLGSYRLSFRRPGDQEVVRPLVVGRAEAVELKVDYRGRDEVGEGFVLVPSGPAVLGGDPVAHGALERHTEDVNTFAIARFPVTCDEYLAFLDALAQEDPDLALRHVPRARSTEGHWWEFDEVKRRFRYPQHSPQGQAWVGALAVNGVSFEDAQAYIRWRVELTGERLRLPHESEWEKAARGADGRFFPWGDHFDPTFCKMKTSRDESYPEPEPVGSFPIDTSPYGIRDMAGGVRELCTTHVGGELAPVMRGGCWHDTGLFCRVAFRHLTQPDFVNSGLGFRLAKDVEG